MDKMEKSDIQESQYVFPYHYLPHFDRAGIPHRIRHLRWGLEYLCYQRHIKALAESLSPSTVIEVGCGDGYLIGSLDSSIARTGVDLSERAIRFACAFHPDVYFAAVDAAQVSGTFDVVLAVEVLEHIPDVALSGFIRTLRDRVKPGGHLIISVPSVVVPVHPKHFRHYTAERLVAQVTEACPELQPIQQQYIYAPPRWLEVVEKITMNRAVAFEWTWLNALIWKYVWTRKRLADANSGRHVVAVFSRRSGI